MSQIALVIIENHHFEIEQVKKTIYSLENYKEYYYFVYSKSEHAHNRFIELATDIEVYNSDQSLKYKDLQEGDWRFSKILML